MLKKDLVNSLENVDDDAEVILVVYTDNGYESGYIDRIDPHCKYNSVTGDRLDDGETVVELTTTVKR